MADLHFAHPEWLLGGAVTVALILALAGVAAALRRRALVRFASAGRSAELTRSVGRGRRVSKIALLAAGVASLFTAAARPSWGFHTEATERQGADLMFAIDTSRSMLAEDVRPNRLTRAKLAVSDLVREFEGDRAGLIAFAGEAFLQCPMTLDRDVFDRSLEALDTDIIPHSGTNLAAAIREATAAFGDMGHEKILVLLTDGENLDGDAVAAAEEAAQFGVRIYTVGVGTAEPSLVPVTLPNGATDLLRDEQGELVRSALDEDTLRRVAEATGGAYEPLGASGRGLERLYAAHLATLPQHAVAERVRQVPDERFQWPLGLGLALLMLEPMIGERRRIARRVADTSSGTPRMAPLASAAAAALLIGSALFGSTAFADDAGAHEPSFFERALDVLGLGSRDAEQAYRRGDYDAAREGWQRRGARPEHTYNAGASAYRAGDFEAAQRSFEGAVRSGDVGLQERAYYDMGNAQFRRGEGTLEGDREATKSAWRDAIHAYESALALDHDDEDARFNLDLVRRRLAGLDEEQEPQNDSSQSQGQDGQSQGQGQDGQSQSQGQDGESQSRGEDGESQSRGEDGESQSRGEDGESQSRGEDGESQSQGQDGESQSRGQSGDAQNEWQDGESQSRGQSGDAQDEGQDGQSESRGQSGDAQSQQDGAQAGGQNEEAQGQRPDESQRGDAQSGHAQSGDASARGATGADPNGDPNGTPAFSGSTGPGAHVGRLTREQATQLLRSLRHEERRFPLTERHEGSPSASPQNGGRSW